MSRMDVASVDRLFWMRRSCSESFRFRSLMAVCSSRSWRISRTVYSPTPAMVISETIRPATRRVVGDRVTRGWAGLRQVGEGWWCDPRPPGCLDDARACQDQRFVPRRGHDLHADWQAVG